ncbi:MAG: beta-lactamase family protein [Clostridia bacterium]|nr:beta-lactamase family protein [Clostridia bacterium]
MICLENVIDEYIVKGILEHIAVRVGKGDNAIYDTYRGGVNENTLFDMASVTKIIVTTSLALIALDKGLLKLDDTVDKFFPTSKSLTIMNLLTHTVGIGHKSLNKEGNSYDNIAERILDIPSDIPIGADVRYSCPGFILLGKILEKTFGMQLSQCFNEFVAKPLGLENTSFLPIDRQNIVNSNLDESKRGIVNDYNCQFLGGVAGNAGVFSNISDVTKYVNFIQNRGKPLISEQTFLTAAQNHTLGMSESRGLGFLYVDEHYNQTGELFSNGAIGHCGHTGQSVFVDYRSGLYVIILSDATISTVKKYGVEHYDEVIKMRELIHRAIKCSLEDRNLVD